MRLGASYENVRSYRAFIRLREGRSQRQFQGELTARGKELQADPVTKLPLVYVAQPFLTHVVGDLGKPSPSCLARPASSCFRRESTHAS
jgi:hypothetical protein